MNGDSVLGRKFIVEAHQLLPEDIQILCDLAVLENKEGNEIRAKQHIQKALIIDPDNEVAREVFQAILYFGNLRKKLLKKVN
jgi:Tfp pilus assembly protein PilF